MTKTSQRVAKFISALVVSTVLVSPVVKAAEDLAAQGKKIAYDRKKGNCLGCHAMGDGAMPGNIGPPLIQMKARFPDKAVLRAQIWDATERNPHTPMPPFGKHGALSDKEVDLITEYVYTL